MTAEIVQPHLRERAARQRPAEAVWIADGEDIVADGQSRNVVPFGGLRFDGSDGDADQCQINAAGRDPHDRGGTRGLAQQFDFELGHLVERGDIRLAVLSERGIDDVPVRDD